MLVFLVNPCDSSPCKNGGTCENDEDTFTCNCTEKFEGPTCDNKGLQFASFESKMSCKFENIKNLKYACVFS